MDRVELQESNRRRLAALADAARGSGLTNVYAYLVGVVGVAAPEVLADALGQLERDLANPGALRDVIVGKP